MNGIRVVSGSIVVRGLAALVTVGLALFTVASASAARTIYLNDSASLHKVSLRGFNLYESGSARGSLAGTVSLHLNIVSQNRVTAQLTFSPRGGSMFGTATASYRNNGATASFSGTMTISRGTGVYAHAHGAALHFSGTIKRINDATSVRVSGKISY